VLCAQCGHENPEGVAQCEACGADLPQDEPPELSETATGQPWIGWVIAALVASALIVIGGTFALRRAITAPKPPAPAVVQPVPALPPPGPAQPPSPPEAGPLQPPPNPLTTPPAEFREARERAREEACLDNLKQAGLAIRMYSVDYDEHFPRAPLWCDEIMPYIRNEGILTCPASGQTRGGYGYNDVLATKDTHLVMSPAQTTIIFDARGGWNVCGGSDLIASRHHNAANAGFVDGHVRWLGTPGGGPWRWKP
jgi:prepilin-type processing-associated H-X9-DG protein